MWCQHFDRILKECKEENERQYLPTLQSLTDVGVGQVIESFLGVQNVIFPSKASGDPEACCRPVG
jgi:hypothetical protein